jgi:hypothetical protein
MKFVVKILINGLFMGGREEMKKLFAILLLMLIVIMPFSPQATTDFTNSNEVFDFLKNAYKAQVSLSEKGRSKEEIKTILDPYFTNEYQELFWRENIYPVNDEYITYGSDFAPYYIPYYQFSDETKVVITPNEIYVFEFFPEKKEGPVGYLSHYEGLYVKKMDNEWKVDKYLYDQIPKEIIERANFSEN